MKSETEHIYAMLTMVSKEVRHMMVAEAAYYRSEKRCFQIGDAIGDWLNAEAEVDQRLVEAFLYFMPTASVWNTEVIVEEYTY